MAQSTILAATASAANSSDVTVVTNIPQTISILPPDANAFTESVNMTVYRKLNALYVPHYDRNGDAVTLSQGRRSVVLDSPGIYRVSKPATTALFGVILDT